MPHCPTIPCCRSGVPVYFLPKMEAFLVSCGLVALAEMGDKTQIATVALAARFQSVYVIVAGTTIGMMIANVPVVYFGEKIARKIQLKVLRFITAGFLGILGILTLVNFRNLF